MLLSALGIGHAELYCCLQSNVMSDSSVMSDSRRQDIAWTEDSKRIVVTGTGNDVYARAILWDSGSSCGDLASGGHIKRCNTCDIKQQRPYRLATGSEDTDVGFYQNVPFKKDHFNTEPNKYVNAVRYSPDGEFFVAADSGGKIYLYDGKEGKFVSEINGGEAQAHKGGIYGISWSSDSKRFMSASADKSVKIWDAGANKCVTTFTAGSDVMDQQVGCIWVGDSIVSTSLSGFINFWDEGNAGAPASIIKGHAENITAMTVCGDSFFAGCTSGRTSSCAIANGQSVVFEASHSSQVITACSAGTTLVTAGMDDTVRITQFGDAKLGATVKLSSQPQGVCILGDLIGVAGKSHITLIRGGKRVGETPAPYGATSISISAGGDVAVGGSDKKVHIYTLSGDTLAEKDALDGGDVVLTVGYSPDGATLAAAGVKRQVLTWDASKYGEPIQLRWKYHTSKVTCLAWSPDSTHIATGSLDTNIYIWSMAKPGSKIKIGEAHPSGCITAIGWQDDNTVFSAGFDGAVRSWAITRA